MGVASALVFVATFLVPVSWAAPALADPPKQAEDLGPLPGQQATKVPVGSPLAADTAVRGGGEPQEPKAAPNATKTTTGAAGYNPSTSKPSSRSEFETVYQNADGTKTAQFSTDPLNVQKSDGSWTSVNTVAVKTSDGGYSVADHPLSPTFGATSGTSAGDYRVSSAGHTISFSLEGEAKKPAGRATAKQRTVSGGNANSSVAYTGVAPGEDLAYEVTPGQVKESLVLNQPPTAANPSWTWRVHAPDLTLAQDKFGDITFTDALGAVIFDTPIPAMFDSSAVPGHSESAVTDVPVTLHQVSDSDWTMTLTPDPSWLNDPSRVYPVFVDPSTASSYADNAHSYESNGTALTGVAYVGNSLAGGDTYWRTVTHFNYEQLFGYQVLGVDLQEWYLSGSTAQTAGAVDYANAFSYSGVGPFLSGITISAGTSGYGDATGAGLTNEIASWVSARSSGNYLMLAGGEQSGAYTYKSLGLEMFISYESIPTIQATNISIPDPNGFAASTSSPGYGHVGSATPTFTTSYTQDASNGDAPVNYNYAISASRGGPFNSPLWTTGWTSTNQVQVPPGRSRPRNPILLASGGRGPIRNYRFLTRVRVHNKHEPHIKCRIRFPRR